MTVLWDLNCHMGCLTGTPQNSEEMACLVDVHTGPKTDSGEMPAPRDPEKPIRLSPHPQPSAGAVLATSPGSKELAPFPLHPLPRERCRSRNPGHTASSKVETSEICRNGKKYIENTFRRRELYVPVIWLPRHVLATWKHTALEFSEKQLIAGQGFLPLWGLW